MERNLWLTNTTSSCIYNIKLYLMPAITYLLEISFERLTDDQQATIKQRFSTQYREIFNHKAVNEYYKSVVIMLLRHDYKPTH